MCRKDQFLGDDRPWGFLASDRVPQKGCLLALQVKANLPLATLLLAQGFRVPYALSLNLMIILCN